MFDLFRARGTVELDDSGVKRELSEVEAKFKETTGRIDRMRATAQMRADASNVTREYEKAEALLRKWQGKRAEAVFDADVDKADRAIAKLEAKMRALDQQRVDIKVGIDRETGLTDKFLAALIGKLRATRREAEGTVNPIRRLGDALHNARLTLGPLSLSLRGMIIALGALAPIVYSLIGALGGLVAVAGQSLIGALGFGGSAALGFGAILGGMIGVVISHRKEIKGLKDQVNGLGQAWKRNTALPRSFGRAIDAGFGAARNLIPLFGRESTRALDAVSRSGERFARRMGGAEMRGVFQQLLSNSRRAIGPLTDALGKLAEAAARVSASFSRHFPNATKALSDWASGVVDSVSDTKGLNGVVDELMASVGSVGSLFSAAGRLVVNFFMAGGKSGRRMLGDVTDLVNKWADWVGSTKGKNQIGKFLDDSWKTVKRVAGVAKELGGLFTRLAPAMKPWVDALLDGLKTVLKLTNAFVDATGGANGLVTILAGLFIISKAIGWAAALGGALSRAATAFASGGLGGFLTGRGGARGGGGGGVVGGAGGKGGARAPGGVFTPAGGSSSTAAAAGRAQGNRFMRGVGQGIKQGGRYLRAGGISAVASILLFPDETSAGDIPTGLQRKATRQASAYRRAFERELMLPRGSLAGQFPVPDTKAGARDFARQARGFEKLARSVSGQAIILRIAMEGDDEVQSFLSRLAQTKLGRKILQIAQRGGPQAFSILNRLAQTKLGQKILNILQRGGPVAQRIVDRLGNTKLREKILSIIQRGGPGVQRQLERILGIRLPTKTQNVRERGSSGVIGVIRKIIGMIIPDKTTTLNAHDNASGVISGVIGMLASVPRSITTVINTIRRGVERAAGGNARGSAHGELGGDVPTMSQTMSAMRGPIVRAGGGKVSSSRFSGSGIVGEEVGFSEFVIPTNPAYRGRAQRLLAQAIRAITPAHARGIAHPRSFFKGKHKIERLRKAVAGGNFFAQYARPVLMKNDEVERNEHALDIMDTRYNTDAQQRDVVDDEGQVITGNVAWHQEQLDSLKKKAELVRRLYRQLANRIDKAVEKIRFVRGVLLAWHPHNEKLKEQRSQRLSDANETLSSMPDWQDAAFSADEYNERAHAYGVERQMISDTKSAPAAADPPDTAAGAVAGADSADSAAVAEQALAATAVANAKLGITEAALTTIQSSGDLGFGLAGGGASSGAVASRMMGLITDTAKGVIAPALSAPTLSSGGGMTVNIHALYPSDPSTYRAIASTAASAFGQQGYVSSPRLSPGI